MATDVGIPSEALDATRGAAVIYQAAQPAHHRWPTDFPPMQAAPLAAAEAHDSKLVMADNLYLYGPIEGSMREDTPPHPVGRKVHLRAQLAEELRSVALRTTSELAASTRLSARFCLMRR